MNNATAARIRTPLQAALNAKLNHISHSFNANEVHLVSVWLCQEPGALNLCRVTVTDHKALSIY